MKNYKNDSINELRKIPGVGKVISGNLWDINIRSINDLKNCDPESIYKMLCVYKNTEIDRCVLYVCRCAVYYASNDKHKPDLLKWWNWKDK